MSPANIPNTPAEGFPYFTPAQIPAAGTAVDPQPEGKPIPLLFQPLKIRGVEFHNRIFVSMIIPFPLGSVAGIVCLKHVD